eukprot:1144464-Pelagomonas_calceolata.AAC.3
MAAGFLRLAYGTPVVYGSKIRARRVKFVLHTCSQIRGWSNMPCKSAAECVDGHVCPADLQPSMWVAMYALQTRSQVHGWPTNVLQTCTQVSCRAGRVRVVRSAPQEQALLPPPPPLEQPPAAASSLLAAPQVLHQRSCHGSSSSSSSSSSGSSSEKDKALAGEGSSEEWWGMGGSQGVWRAWWDEST